jgi:hypothetical protein
MSDYADRLERALLDAGRRSYERPRRGVLTMFASAAVTAAVVAIVFVTGVFGHGGATTTPPPAAGTVGNSPTTTIPATGGLVASPACHEHRAGNRIVLPPLRFSSGKPNAHLLGELAGLRAPATAADHIDRDTFDRTVDTTLSIFTRYVRTVDGPDGTRITLIPSVACNQALRNKPGTVVQTMVMQVSGPRFLRDSHPTTVIVGDWHYIASGLAFATVGSTNRGWLQIAVEPDRVAKVFLQLSYLDRPVITRTLEPRNNVITVFPTPPGGAKDGRLYDAGGKVIKGFEIGATKRSSTG